MSNKKTTVDKIPIVINFVARKRKTSPSNIAKNIGSDIRTTNKVLSNLSNIGVLQTASFSTGSKTYSAVSLTENYKTVFNKLDKKNLKKVKDLKKELNL